MAAYLADLPRTDAERAAGVEQSLELLRHGLNGYGHQYLAPRDRERWSSAYEEGSEDAFCQMFGTTQLVKYIDEFLGYFLIRKVLMPEDQVAQTVEDVRAFLSWLAERGEIRRDTARKVLGRTATASIDLPAAERLGRLLHEIARHNEQQVRPGSAGQFDELVEDFLVIERVAPGRLWFLDGVGPIKVPEAASAVARPGWTINLDPRWLHHPPSRRPIAAPVDVCAVGSPQQGFRSHLSPTDGGSMACWPLLTPVLSF